MSQARKALTRLSLVFVTTVSFGQTLLTTIPVPDYPQAMAINTFTDRVYVLEESANQVTEIDGSTHAGVAIPLGKNSISSLNGALAINPFTNKIYAVDGVNNHLSIIDGPTHAVTQINVGNAPVALALNPVTNTIYVVNQSDNTVSVIDGTTLATTTIPVGAGPTGIAVDSTAQRIYVTDTLRDEVFVLDMQGTVLQTIGKEGQAEGEFNYPTEVRLDGENLPVDLFGGFQPTTLMVLKRNPNRFGNRCHAGIMAICPPGGNRSG